jgi:hypothetical protein
MDTHPNVTQASQLDQQYSKTFPSVAQYTGVYLCVTKRYIRPARLAAIPWLMYLIAVPANAH